MAARPCSGCGQSVFATDYRLILLDDDGERAVYYVVHVGCRALVPASAVVGAGYL